MKGLPHLVVIIISSHYLSTAKQKPFPTFPISLSDVSVSFSPLAKVMASCSCSRSFVIFLTISGCSYYQIFCILWAACLFHILMYHSVNVFMSKLNFCQSRMEFFSIRPRKVENTEKGFFSAVTWKWVLMKINFAHILFKVGFREHKVQ